MKKKDEEKKSKAPETPEAPVPETPATEAPPQQAPAQEEAAPQTDPVKEALAAKEDAYLRLAAEYDNFRKRTAKEKEGIYHSAKTDAVTAFLPVYDNLERALKQDTADEAYKKGVEMTMAGLKEVLAKLGVEEIPALGQPFDPNLHNAVMHVEDGAAGENTVVEVFQTGFKLGDKVVRFAMVKVAN